MRLALLFAAIGVATLLLRGSFILFGGGASSKRLDPIRRFVPVAALTALLVPALLPASGEPAYARALAAAIAAAVAYKSKNVLATVAAGLALLLLLS